jgi:hypothetical protein
MEPATFRYVACCLKHYATMCPPPPLLLSTLQKGVILLYKRLGMQKLLIATDVSFEFMS